MGWRLSSVDSIAIWNQYASLKEGVAISLPHEDLQRSLKVNGDIRLGVVNYVDFNAINEPQHMPPFLYKDVRYASEEEARFYFRARVEDVAIRGYGMKVDVNSLVKDIYIAPNADPWFKSLVADIAKSYGLLAGIVDSPLSKMPRRF